ncbi:Uncharacterised protein [Kluyvera cryocrescens]|uniref:Uncharacterized protein n=1 Tax=Kluyvera cryocrescens TaxID=580 RepID=A0A485D5C0_KLUCR|nr:Uncharacterised protein [Kluyvera cryocrescens]
MYESITPQPEFKDDAEVDPAENGAKPEAVNQQRGVDVNKERANGEQEREDNPDELFFSGQTYRK